MPCGNNAYFFNTEQDNAKEVIEAFLLQFYQNREPPKEILLSQKINSTPIEQALQKLHNNATKISTPKIGTKKKIIINAMENAEFALKTHLKNTQKNTHSLEEVKSLFDLKNIPSRIEVYDNSHIQGKFAIGAMIVAGKEGFNKKEYRLFTIKEQAKKSTGGDDYAMLREVLSRRLVRLKNEPERKPSLMIIDGGKAHMNVVVEIMKKFACDIIFVCMSKGKDRNAGNEQFHMPEKEPFTLDKNSNVMKYLQILRDEVHNFVIKSHRKKRSKAIKHSFLDTIDGIGIKKKKALLQYFGSLNSISNSSIEELSKVDGISKTLAQNIFNSLH